MYLIFISIHVEKSPAAFPLAAAILETDILRHPETQDWRTEIIEFQISEEISSVSRRLIEKDADAYCFSACSWNTSMIIDIVSRLRKEKPRAMFIAGGPQATAVPEEFERTGLFNFVIEGEGEGKLASILCDRKEPSPFEFSKSPSPYLSIMKKKKKIEGVLWEISRGCPYNCAFCYESRGSRKIRTITDERIISELKLFKKNRISRIWVLDPTFNHSSKHAEKILKAILRYHPDAHYTFEIRAELMSRELCRLFSMVDASLQIGLQSTDDQVLKNVNRSLNKEKFLKQCDMMSQEGLTYGIDIIYGLPSDTISKFKDTLDFAVSAGPNNIDIFPLSVLPGTELSDKKEEYQLNNTGFPEYTFTGNPLFPPSDLKKAAEITGSCDLIYNREQAFPWFRTVLKLLSLPASTLFEQFSKEKKTSDIIDFLAKEFKKQKKDSIFPLIESLILWSRAAETAFSNPGTEFLVKLCRRPEELDQLTGGNPELQIKKMNPGKLKNYRIIFDGEELYIN